MHGLINQGGFTSSGLLKYVRIVVISSRASYVGRYIEN